MNLRRVATVVLLVLVACTSHAVSNGKNEAKSPRIINIINFIRQTDYRVENSDSLLFEATQKQIELLKKYDFPATFLFQYDALINPKYQKLMKTKLGSKCEIGAWWEITQPHVEAAGIKWRGEHSWVSHANIAFTTGYSPAEREKLVDVYMAKFKEIYGKYPKSVGSWFVDSYTLNYMYYKYGIVASCNCKDQIGTDGYTLWGGYWNQAYYPSKLDAYMPAQTKEKQIPVPIFRMLGSDPIYQYDTGIGHGSQGVISLEPVYPEAGRSKKWVEYFLESLINEPCLAFNYAQAGQENSFTWEPMKDGLEMQFPLFDSLRTANKIKIETLEHSGIWFKENFTTTPATAFTTLSDVRNEGRKGVWFNSRYYRANLFWENKSFRFRDIHLFNENYESDYYQKAGEGSQFFYFTLPIVDGYMWSTTDDRAGLRIVKLINGKKEEVLLDNPLVSEPSKGVLQVVCKDDTGNVFNIVFRENQFEVSCQAKDKNLNWALELNAAKGKELPFSSMENNCVKAEFKNFKYGIICDKGTVKKAEKSEDYIFRLVPENNVLVVDCTIPLKAWL